MYKFKNPEVIQQIEDNYPEMTNEYKKIMWEQYETFCLKQSSSIKHQKRPDKE